MLLFYVHETSQLKGKFSGRTALRFQLCGLWDVAIVLRRMTNPVQSFIPLVCIKRQASTPYLHQTFGHSKSGPIGNFCLHHVLSAMWTNKCRVGTCPLPTVRPSCEIQLSVAFHLLIHLACSSSTTLRGIMVATVHSYPHIRGQPFAHSERSTLADLTFYANLRTKEPEKSDYYEVDFGISSTCFPLARVYSTEQVLHDSKRANFRCLQDKLAHIDLAVHQTFSFASSSEE